MDHRALFFAGAAMVCGALTPATDADLRWVPFWMAIAYMALAVLSFLDWWSRRVEHASDRAPRDPDAPEDQPNRPVM